MNIWQTFLKRGEYTVPTPKYPSGEQVYHFLCKWVGFPPGTEQYSQALGDPHFRNYIDSTNAHLIQGIAKTNDLMNTHLTIAPVNPVAPISHLIMQLVGVFFQ